LDQKKTKKPLPSYFFTAIRQSCSWGRRIRAICGTWQAPALNSHDKWWNTKYDLRNDCTWRKFKEQTIG